MSVVLKFPNKVAFRSIEFGDAFTHNGNVYVKIKPSTAKDNAYRVGGDSEATVLATFSSTDSVSRVKLEVFVAK